MDATDDPELLRAVREMGARLHEGVAALDGVREVRGRGLMVGVGLEDGLDSTEIAGRLLEAGLVVNAPEPATLRLLPPLVVGKAEIDEAVGRLAGAL